MERVTTLLSHYWTGDEPAELRRLQMADWLEDLKEFAAQYVTMAIRDWRHSDKGNRRPTPNDIRLLTIAAQAASRRKEAKPAAPVPLMLEGPDDGYRREPMPPQDVIRPHWMTLRFPDLTKAEQKLCREWNRRSFEELPAGPWKDRLLAVTGPVL